MAAVGILRIGTSLRAAAQAAAPRTEVLRGAPRGDGHLGRNPRAAHRPGAAHPQLVVVFTVFGLGPAYMRNVLGRQPDDTPGAHPATMGMVATANRAGPGQRLR